MAREHVLAAIELAGIQNRVSGAAAHRGGKESLQRGEEWGQGISGRLGGAPIGGAGGRWAGKSGSCGAGEALVKLEVGDEVGDLSVICKK